MKKKNIFAMILAATLFLSPTAMQFVTNDQPVAEAKRIKSGKGGFNMNNNKQQPSKSVNKEQQKNNVNSKSNTKIPAATKSKGGFMGGLMMGGIAGLLFGGMLANMGALGPIIGMLLNVLVIVAVIGLLLKLIRFLFKKNPPKEDKRQWNS